MLREHKRYKKCPTWKFDNSRQGFEEFKNTLLSYAPLENCAILLEKTGHYHHALVQYLQEIGVTIYEIHVQKKGMEHNKNDRLDAQTLANTLYNQRVLGVDPNDTEQKIQQVTLFSEAAQSLRPLIRRRYETDQECIRRKNKLIAICDQLFPEFAEIIKDPNGPTALVIRERFPSPQALAHATFDELRACRTATRPGNADLIKLQEAARHSIGIKAPARVEALCFEQQQLIIELRLLLQNLADLDNKIAEIVESSREGRILLSLGCIGPAAAGAIIAAVGSIGNIESAAKLRALLGWAPVWDQTGTSKDSMKLSKKGSRPLKKILYLVGWRAISDDTEWRTTYERLVPLKCQWDSRKQEYIGRNKVLGKIIGQIIGTIYFLLRKDYETIIATPPGQNFPPPVLYNRDIHRKHRHLRPL